ncbi:MAG: hypothetical protein ACRDFS_00340 [Chloroflexota bacterium]
MTEVQVDAILQELDRRLPEMARDVIRRHLDVSQAQNIDFAKHPDSREHHQTRWHQWGIISHTRVFLRDFEVRVPEYLESWGLWEPVRHVLEVHIDGVSKLNLLRIAILLHDLGKFGARTRGKERFHFSGHEKLSGQIVTDELDLAELGLTADQISYIGLAARDHFVLGTLRQNARSEGQFDAGFLASDRFEQLALEVKRQHPDDWVEIGVLFLGDSLAKANPPEGPEPALEQYQLNIDTAHRYLSLVLGHL